MKNGIQPVHGSYLTHLGTLRVTNAILRSLPQRACPVCCRYFGRDRDMIVVVKRRTRWWVCKSVWEGDLSCGFAFRVRTRADQVVRIAAQRRRHLSF